VGGLSGEGDDMGGRAMGGLTREERLVGLATVWSEVKYNYPMWHRHPDLDWDRAFRERVPGALVEQSAGVKWQSDTSDSPVTCQ
jgi:hypothetical protein